MSSDDEENVDIDLEQELGTLRCFFYFHLMMAFISEVLKKTWRSRSILLQI